MRFAPRKTPAKVLPAMLVATMLAAIVTAVNRPLAPVAASASQDKPGAADEIQIRQLERAWNQAESKQEVNQVSSLMADSLVYTDYDGSFMNKAEYLKWVAAPDQKADHLYDEGMTVHVYGDAAVVNGIYRETGTNKGKPYVIRSRYTDTWIKQKGTWLCAASHSTLIPKK